MKMTRVRMAADGLTTLQIEAISSIQVQRAQRKQILLRFVIRNSSDVNGIAEGM
jgi:hypothetical protein